MIQLPFQAHITISKQNYSRKSKLLSQSRITILRSNEYIRIDLPFLDLRREGDYISIVIFSNYCKMELLSQGQIVILRFYYYLEFEFGIYEQRKKFFGKKTFFL